MSTKYFCDGCDMELINYNPAHARMHLMVVIGPELFPHDHPVLSYDLCKTCGARMHEATHPGSWPRGVDKSDPALAPGDEAWFRKAEAEGKIPSSCDVEIRMPFDEWVVARRALCTTVPADEKLVRGAQQSFTINRIKFVTPMAFGPLTGEDMEKIAEAGADAKVFDPRHSVQGGPAPLPWQGRKENAQLFQRSIDDLMQALVIGGISSSQVRMVIQADVIHKISDMLALAIGTDAATFRLRPDERKKYGYAMYNGLRFDYE